MNAHEYIDLDQAKTTKKQLTKLLENLNEAIYRIEESAMDVEQGKDPSPILWAYEEVIAAIYRKIRSI